MSFELERIEELCQGHGWNHYRLATEMDTPPNNIGSPFRRTAVPSIPTTRRICDVVGITITRFYSTDDVRMTLNPQQRRVLGLYDRLDQTDKLRAEVHVEDLSAKDQSHQNRHVRRRAHHPIRYGSGSH